MAATRSLKVPDDNTVLSHFESEDFSKPFSVERQLFFVSDKSIVEE